MVAGDGAAQDVWVLESTLGNYDVERCLVEVGRKIRFHAPNGNKATTFEYPVEFRSESGMEILDVDGPKVDRDLAMLLPQLAACGQIASEQVNVMHLHRVERRPRLGRPGDRGGDRRGRRRLRRADDPHLAHVGRASPATSCAPASRSRPT